MRDWQKPESPAFAPHPSAHAPSPPHLAWGGRDPHDVIMDACQQLASNTVELGQELGEVKRMLAELTAQQKK